MCCRKQKGQALVEFALILPLLLLVFFGIIEFSLLIFNRAVITNASREGARAGIVSQSPRVTADEIEQIVNDYCANYLISFQEAAPATAAVSSAANWNGATINDTLTVTVNYTYSFLILPDIVALGDSLQLTGRTVMRYE
jgi:Flp pilus assembly protein TadG